MNTIDLKSGMSVGGFRLKSPIARSRWTSLYSAISKDLPGKFAVKIFDLSGSNEKAIGTPDEGVWLKRFDLEGRILAAMDHPGVIALVDRGSLPDGRPYHVLPFVEANLIYEMGGDISDPAKLSRLAPPRRPRALTYERALSLLVRITDALEALHQMDIIHRDLKPGNVLLSRKKGGDPVLCDFGMARWGDQMFDVPGELIGSRDYVSPEQEFDPKAAGKPADVYALGRIAYRMFSGKLPALDDGAIAADLPEMPPSLAELILRCLKNDPAQRPADAVTVQGVLEGGEISSWSNPGPEA